ncbi:hypothetical protein [Pseudomonas savastanoi]|uniref:hypothetical protein n=1 Tax=Pseudomonas savastanoi TaxID=29438 RepID=UPI0012B9A848|nr:hypothetical protein [Pseudomonas savastanoi]
MINTKTLVNRIVNDAFALGFTAYVSGVAEATSRCTSLDEVHALLFKQDGDATKPLVVEFQNHSRLATQWELDAPDAAHDMNLPLDVVTSIASGIRSGRVMLVPRTSDTEASRILWICGNEMDAEIDLGN